MENQKKLTVDDKFSGIGVGGYQQISYRQDWLDWYNKLKQNAINNYNQTQTVNVETWEGIWDRKTLDRLRMLGLKKSRQMRKSFIPGIKFYEEEPEPEPEPEVDLGTWAINKEALG